MHARDGLERVGRFSLDHGDHPLVVTTEARDWSVFELDRAWASREGSIVFVLSEGHTQHVPAQVSTLLSPGFLVRRSPLFINQEAARELATRVREVMGLLLGDPNDAMKRAAKDAGLRCERIDWGGAALDIADRVVEEALKYDRLDALLRRLEVLYPIEEVRVLLRELRRISYRDE